MRIIEYYASDNKKHWLRQIRKTGWLPGKHLFYMLYKNKLKEKLGVTTLVPMLVEGDELIAFCTLAPLDNIQPTDMSPWIGFVYTFPKYRGNHYAGMLLDYAENVAAAMGKEYTYITTKHTGIYEKYGYDFYKIEKNMQGRDSRVYRTAISAEKR